jgi:hypothetical protein
MDAEKIIKVTTNIFEAADERDSSKAKDSFADDVLLDYPFS